MSLMKEGLPDATKPNGPPGRGRGFPSVVAPFRALGLYTASVRKFYVRKGWMDGRGKAKKAFREFERDVLFDCFIVDLIDGQGRKGKEHRVDLNLELDASRPASFVHAPTADSMTADGSTTAVAVVRILAVTGPSRNRPGGLLYHSIDLGLEFTLHALRTVTTTACAVGIGRYVTATGTTVAPSACSNSHRKSLDDTARGLLSWTLTWKHAIVGREISADHIGFHGRSVSCQCFRLVGHIDVDKVLTGKTEAATCVQSGSFKQRERCTTGVDRKTHEADAACSVGVDADEAR
nr:hypothetical protein CFP56_37065 [Quercus suber]